MSNRLFGLLATVHHKVALLQVILFHDRCQLINTSMKAFLVRKNSHCKIIICLDILRGFVSDPDNYA